MTEATRAVALSEAGKLNLGDATEVLAVAARFDAFLSGQDTAKDTAAPAKSAAKPAGKAATKAASKTEEEVVKAALEAQKAEAEAAEGGDAEPTADDGVPASAEGVQAGIAKLLKANKRKEAIGLLKKFGAASASGIKPKDYVKFVGEVNALLGSEDEGDLTA